MATFKPTPAQEDLIGAFQEQLAEYGHILMSGTNTFPCLMSPIDPVELAMSDSFPDPREVTVASVLHTDLPAWVVAQMQLVDEMGQAWTTVKRNENPAQIAAQLYLVKVTDKDH